MSAMSRFGPSLARSVFIQQQRHIASAGAATEPIQKLFLDKIRDFKTSNIGLDETHNKMLQDELLRLKRVYQVEDESKLAQLEYKFANEHNVALYDIDSSKELRHQIQSGEYHKQLTAQPAPKSALLESIPDQSPREMSLPALNKPDMDLILENCGVPKPHKLGEPEPDYKFVGNSKITPDDIERELRVKFADDMPTINDDKAPGRDAVNFPRQSIRDYAPPTRCHIIPESWFQFFYQKTGVSGPYVFAGAFSTFLLSKEWLVFEHELLTAFSSICIFAWALPKFGPVARKYLITHIEEEVKGWDDWQKGNIETLSKVIDNYKQALDSGNIIDELYKARKQEVDLQLECEYRDRLQKAYGDTKRRLNYLVSVADSQRQIHHTNMVNWVISNVHSSFGPKQESEVLDSCILNLKQLAAKKANVI